MSQQRINNRNQGFTLFELMVAIALVALMVGIVATQTSDWFDANLKKTTGRLSATIRYLHDKASTENLYIRLIFDFDKNSYWVEATTEQFLLSTKEMREAEAVELEEEAEEGPDEEIMEVTEEGEDGEAKTVTLVQKYRTPEFGAVDEFLLKPVQIPDGVFLKDIYTSHDEGPINGGQVAIHFFPNGYIEPSIINLRDEDDEVNFSIEINPIIGSTKLSDEYKSMEKESK